MSSRCFTVAPITSRFDLANLEEYGTLTALAERGPHIWNAEHAIRDIKEWLTNIDFEPASDFIVFTGQTMLVTYMSLAVSEYMLESRELRKDHGWTGLVYNARDREYQTVKVPLPGSRKYHDESRDEKDLRESVRTPH